MRCPPQRLPCSLVVTVVGIGADGWDGLTPSARAALTGAEVIVGAAERLAALPQLAARRVRWPGRTAESLPGILADHTGSRICVLVDGDPMFLGVGPGLARLLGTEQVRVIPTSSSVSLACARLGWPVEQVDVVDLADGPIDRLHADLAPGRRLIVLGGDEHSPNEVAMILATEGFGDSAVTVFERLGGPAERQVGGSASRWMPGTFDRSNLVAVDCAADPAAVWHPRVAGLPGAAFGATDPLAGPEVRAMAHAGLAPLPGQLLWDVSGHGGVGIEWMRHHPSCRAMVVVADPVRADAVRADARALGVPALEVVVGALPGVLGGLPEPHAVHLAVDPAELTGVLDLALTALRTGGRLVVSSVDADLATLATWQAKLGGTLTRLDVARVEHAGENWTSTTPVLQWAVRPR